MRAIPEEKESHKQAEASKQLLKEVTQKKIDYLLSKRIIKDVEVYVLIKEFFKEFLQAHYEFTFDELIEELKKVYIEKAIKDRLVSLLHEFSTIEYKDEEIPQEKLKVILADFRECSGALIRSEKRKQSFFGRMFGKKELEQVPTMTVGQLAVPLQEEQPVKQELPPMELPVQEEQPKDDTQEMYHEPTKDSWVEPEPAHVELSTSAQEASGQAWEAHSSASPDWTSEANRVAAANNNEEFSFDTNLIQDVSHQEAPIVEEPVGAAPVQEEAQATPEQAPIQEPVENAAPATTPEVDLQGLADQLDAVIQDDPNVQFSTQTEPAAQVDGMAMLITETERLVVEHNLPEAKNAYKELLGRYNELSDAEKHKYYEDINRLYLLLQHG